MALRDAGRLRDCAARLNFCPLGSGAVAGATLALDRNLAARELGFTAPTANSIDATAIAISFWNICKRSHSSACISADLRKKSRFSPRQSSVLSLFRGFFDRLQRHAPEENPDLTELIRGKVGRIHGAAEAVTLQLKGLPLAYNKDLQETQEPAFSVDFVPQMLKLVARFTAALRFNRERMSKAAQSGCLNAMAAATYLVHKGVPFRTAHEKIGHAVRFAIEKGVELGALTLDELRQFGTEFEEDFFAAVTLAATLDCHDVTGGTARERVRQALAIASERIKGLGAHTSTQEAFMLVRKALLTDATKRQRFGQFASGDGTLLKRSFAEVCENIRDFTVALSDGGVFLGCGALHFYGPHLCEVRSIVVKPAAKSQGAGGRILTALIEEAEEHGIQSVCLFTRIPDFFFKYGFRTVEDNPNCPIRYSRTARTARAPSLRRSRHGRDVSTHLDSGATRRSAAVSQFSG